MDKEYEPTRPQLDLSDDSTGFEVWDELFEPLWVKIVGSFKKHCPSISVQDAEDMAAETIHLLVRYFDHHELTGLGKEDCRRRMWGYIKRIQPGVKAAFFKQRATESELRESELQSGTTIPSDAETIPPAPSTVVRDAMYELSEEDRELLYLRIVNGWTFPQIQEEVQQRWRSSSSLGALRMRFPRALAELHRSILKRL